MFLYAIRKDDICFRRKKPGRIPTKDSFTQSLITCKPSICYEFKKVDDESQEIPPIYVQYRRDEKDSKNPFASKPKENNEIKVNHRNTEKNGGHRHQTRQQDEYGSLRGKRASQRNKDDERREQLNVDRTKRKRSRSLSKERKRARRSRSRSRSRPRRERERNVHERNSPEKTSRNQVATFNQRFSIICVKTRFLLFSDYSSYRRRKVRRSNRNGGVQSGRRMTYVVSFDINGRVMNSNHNDIPQKRNRSQKND